MRVVRATSPRASIFIASAVDSLCIGKGLLLLSHLEARAAIVTISSGVKRLRDKMWLDVRVH